MAPPESVDFLEDEQNNPEEEQVEEAASGDSGVSGDEAEKPVVNEPDFGGLPFKSVEELVKAHKELQGHSTRRNQEYASMQQVLQQVVPLLNKKEQAEVKEDPEAFVKAFVENPKAVLGELINAVLQGQVQKTLAPIQGQVGSIGSKMELQEFQRNHPEFGDAEANLLSQIMDKYPEVGRRSDRLEAWHKLMLAEHPEVGEKLKQKKVSLEASAAEAKKAAALGGNKSTNPKPPADEFDDLINLYSDRYSYYMQK